MQSLVAQTLSLGLNTPEPAKVGEKAWYVANLENDTDKPIIFFLSPMADYGVAGHKCVVSFNDSVIYKRSTSWLDANERFSEKAIIKLAPGETIGLLGFRFPVDKPGAYLVHFTYYQDPSNMERRWATSKKVATLARGITVFKTELKEYITIK